MRSSLHVLALACVSALLAGYNGGGSTGPTVQAGTPLQRDGDAGAIAPRRRVSQPTRTTTLPTVAFG